MAKTRVHELAKELGYNSKDLLDKIIAMGIDAKSHMAALEDEDVETIRKKLGGATKASAKKETKEVKETKQAKEPKEEKKFKPVVIVERKADREAAQKKVEETLVGS